MSVTQPGLQTSETRRISAGEQLYEHLRARIVSLELTPGVQLSRSELASSYDVSQMPVREALRQLEMEGLVVVYPQSRTEVARINVAQARETQFLRLSLELEVAREVCGAPARTAAAAQIVAQQETALRQEADLAGFFRLDKQFHKALFDAAGVADLWKMLQTRSGHIDRLRALSFLEPHMAETILANHREILERIASGQVAGAQAAVRQHLSGTLSKLEEIRAAHAGFF
jgi:GntR family transcriptional regulator, rspAB operon transcriptional repressor